MIATNASAATSVLAVHARTTADAVAGVIAFAFTGIILVVLVLFLARWKRARGAQSRADALQMAFGVRGQHAIVIGCFTFAAIALILVVVIKSTGG
jgi:hypothetical protein